jgi:hypothetical protein
MARTGCECLVAAIIVLEQILMLALKMIEAGFSVFCSFAVFHAYY